MMPPGRRRLFPVDCPGNVMALQPWRSRLSFGAATQNRLPVLYCLGREIIISMQEMNDLDFQTACIICFFSNICIAVLLAASFADTNTKGVRLWIAGLLAQTAASPFFALRGIIPEIPAVIIGNVLFASSWSLVLASFDAFFGNRRTIWCYGLPLVAVAAILLVSLHDARIRTMSFTTLYAVQSALVAVTILHRVREFRRRVVIVFSGGYVMATFASLLRWTQAYLAPPETFAPFAPGPLQSAALLLSVPTLAACTLGFVLLHRDRVEKDVRHLADIDHLTGLFNRRGFEAMFSRELREAARFGAWTSLALVDIDHFKAVNDGCGHAAGDKALSELARILCRELRGGDGVGRIGGDEFCVLLSGTPPERAAVVAERLREAVAAHDWRAFGLTVPLTVTIGLASHRGDGDGADFMHLADTALLAAKAMARDMVLHADDLAAVHARSAAC